MRLLLNRGLCIAAIAIFPTFVFAQPERSALSHLVHLEAALQIEGRNGEVISYSPSELESFPTYRLETTTPWREVPAVFEGVLLADVLREHGLHSAGAIRMTAENDFNAVFDREVWEAAAFLIATRVDGRPHTRRARGPLQIVVAADDYQRIDIIGERHLVWSLSRIEPAE